MRWCTRAACLRQQDAALPPALKLTASTAVRGCPLSLQPVPDKGEKALPSFALVYMDVDTVDYVLLPDVRLGYGSSVDKDGKREWHEEELNP